ncbi:MAG: SDR family oxidoreductase [Acidobacteriota bacterium]|nr:MAG: SDR family oxidoreductase [Acidobacteriota bacterium]
MRALVTGGGGFIGSNLVQALLGRGDDVTVLDDFSTGRRENLLQAPQWARDGGSRYELLEADVRDEQAVRDAVDGCELVFHQAALASVARSVSDPLTSHTVNVDGTLKLLLAARDAGVRRVVFASSSSVYGESPTLPKVETMSPEPISPYGLDKLAAETYCRLFTRLYGLQTVALRYFNVFGPRQDPSSDYAAVIPNFISRMSTGQQPIIFGTGEQTRDFSFIDNVVRANLQAASAPPEACGEAYNIACGERVSLLELVRRINAVLGTHLEPMHDAPRAGDIQHSLADIGKACGKLRYSPSVGLEEGLARTVDWFTGAETTG